MNAMMKPYNPELKFKVNFIFFIRYTTLSKLLLKVQNNFHLKTYLGANMTQARLSKSIIIKNNNDLDFK